MIIQTKIQTGKLGAAAHAASVDVTADVESHDHDSEQGDDRQQRVLRRNPEDNPEEELEPCVDYITRAKYKADDLLAANGITSWILRQSQIYWRQARMSWTMLVSS